MLKIVNILNKKARFDYEIIETYTAGIVLVGTEIKSIRLGKANITESFCEFSNTELFAINTYIEEYTFGNQFNHKARSERKLLLKKKELKGFKEFKDIGLQAVIDGLPYKSLVADFATACNNFANGLIKVKAELDFDFDFDEYFEIQTVEVEEDLTLKKK